MELPKTTQIDKIQILTAKNSGAVAIYTTAVYMKPSAPVNDSLLALENHLSDLYLQPDDINILCDDVNIGHSRESSKKLIFKTVSAVLACNVWTQLNQREKLTKIVQLLMSYTPIKSFK